MPLFAQNIVLVVPSGHAAQTCWKLLLTGQSTAPAEVGSEGCTAPSHRVERGTKLFWRKGVRVCPGGWRDGTQNKPGLKKV